MIKSMTGFAQVQTVVDGGKVSVEIRAVNGRYADVLTKMPRTLNVYENDLKKQVQEVVQRGRVTVHLQYEQAIEIEDHIQINWPLIEASHGAIQEIQTKLNLKEGVALDRYPHYSEFFAAKTAEESKSIPAYDVLKPVIAQALAEFDAMRQEEGAHLEKDLSQHLGRLRDLMHEIVTLFAKTKESYRSKLIAGMKEILQDIHIDEHRILLEAAVFAERIDIAEEVVRFESHLDKMDTLMKAGGALGRKFEFILQELNREVNTLSNKCSDFAISELSVEAKSELEKMREQIQNVE